VADGASYWPSKTRPAQGGRCRQRIAGGWVLGYNPPHGRLSCPPPAKPPQIGGQHQGHRRPHSRPPRKRRQVRVAARLYIF
jgi:hypothetical protein